jgi:hypothetical protein
MPPPPSPDAMEIMAPAPEASILPPGVKLLAGERELRLEELEKGEIPVDSTITVLAEPSVSYGVVLDVLKKVHDLGYLVHVPTPE